MLRIASMWREARFLSSMLLESLPPRALDLDFADPDTGQSFLHVLCTPARGRTGAAAASAGLPWWTYNLASRIREGNMQVDLLATDLEGNSIIGLIGAKGRASAETLFREWQFQRGGKTRSVEARLSERRNTERIACSQSLLSVLVGCRRALSEWMIPELADLCAEV